LETRLEETPDTSIESRAEMIKQGAIFFSGGEV